jgi:hypothetical protein
METHGQPEQDITVTKYDTVWREALTRFQSITQALHQTYQQLDAFRCTVQVLKAERDELRECHERVLVEKEVSDTEEDILALTAMQLYRQDHEVAKTKSSDLSEELTVKGPIIAINIY